MSFETVGVLPSPFPDSGETLRILPLSDLHLPKPSSALILANQAYLETMDFVVLLGDMVQCYGTDDEYAALNEFIGGLKRPYGAVMGNHEWYFEIFDETSGLYGEVWDEQSGAKKQGQQRKFARFFGFGTLWRAFSHPLGHFVFLSIDKVRGPKQEAFSASQLEFLEKEIMRAGDKPLFVFCHAPLMLETRLDMIYYEEARSGCVEASGELKKLLLKRAAPSFWMSGHVHLHPDHYLFPPYRCGGNVWQIHCPDSWGYGRWTREQFVPARYVGLFSRHLEIDGQGVNFVTFDHRKRTEVGSQRVDFG